MLLNKYSKPVEVSELVKTIHFGYQRNGNYLSDHSDKNKTYSSEIGMEMM